MNLTLLDILEIFKTLGSFGIALIITILNFLYWKLKYEKSENDSKKLYDENIERQESCTRILENNTKIISETNEILRLLLIKKISE